MLIDTHCHIHDKQYHFDPQQVLSRAHYNEVQKIIVIGTSPRDNLAAQAFAKTHENVYWAYGFHPSEQSVDNITFGSLSERGVHAPIPSRSAAPAPCKDRSARKASPKSNIVDTSRSEPTAISNITNVQRSEPIAIGEIGLDYHYKPYNRAKQIKRLEKMLDLAQKNNLPIIFHVREAFTDFWPIIDNAKIKKAVLHSFGGTEQNLKKALERNFYIGVNGLATFSNIPLPPLKNMLLETDAPYLTPAPFRGKINEPSYVKNIAEWVADKLQTPFSEVARETTANAVKLFNL